MCAVGITGMEKLSNCAVCNNTSSTQKATFWPVMQPKCSFQVGASGDTELFEKASNINGFQGGRVANNLYISLFSGDCFSDSRPFSIPQFKCRDLGGKSAFSFAVACVLNMTWVFSHAGGSGGSQTDKPLKINTFHFHRKEVRRWLYSVSKRPEITQSCPTTICGICRCR
mgnify:CR=1 FL=1